VGSRRRPCGSRSSAPPHSASSSWPGSQGSGPSPHVHPRAEEVFHVLEGRAAFRIGNGEDRIVGPGTVLLAPPET
jgi:quercetin dioxygenase-like cupin family protein